MKKIVLFLFSFFYIITGCSTGTMKSSSSINKKFAQAVLSDNLELAKELIKKGADINIRGNRNRTLLHIAAGSNKHGLTLLLINNGADVNARDSNGDSPLHMAALNLDMEIIKLLVEEGADINIRNRFGEIPLYHIITSPLHKNGIVSLKSSQDDIPSIFPNRGSITSYFGWRRSLWHKGNDFHLGIDIAAPPGTEVRATAQGIIVKAGMNKGYGNYVKIKHSSGFSTLYAHLKKIITFQGCSVKKGEVIGLVGSTGNATGPHCHYEIRDCGAIVNPYPYLHGKTLDEINREAVYEMTALFIQKGVDLNYRTELERTLLHEAAVKDYKLAELLVKKGADINRKDYKGRTPLHEAVRANRIKIAVLLLQKGAEVNSRTSAKFKDLNSIVYPEKCTPLKIASLSGFSRMVHVLKKFGARE